MSVILVSRKCFNVCAEYDSPVKLYHKFTTVGFNFYSPKKEPGRFT